MYNYINKCKQLQKIPNRLANNKQTNMRQKSHMTNQPTKTLPTNINMYTETERCVYRCLIFCPVNRKFAKDHARSNMSETSIIIAIASTILIPF